MDGRMDVEPEFLQGELRRGIEGMLELGKKRLIILNTQVRTNGNKVSKLENLEHVTDGCT